jgi:hypothetical protein
MTEQTPYPTDSINLADGFVNHVNLAEELLGMANTAFDEIDPERCDFLLQAATVHALLGIEKQLRHNTIRDRGIGVTTEPGV